MKKYNAGQLAEFARVRRLSSTALRVLSADNAWQQRARLLQISWGMERFPELLDQDYPWRIAASSASPYRGDDNFLTGTIAKEVARSEIPEPDEPGRVMVPVRLRTNLLSSQPLCFNAFGELSAQGRDEFATAVLGRLFPDLLGQVTAIRYEHNPSRGPLGLIGTESAFDVFVDLVTPDGDLAFLGIEVKYHEAMNDTAPAKEARRESIRLPRREAMERAARRVGCELDQLLTSKPGQRKVWQVWMDHSLALAMLDPELQREHPELRRYRRGAFVMLSPEGNSQVRGSYDRYAGLIADADLPQGSLRFCSLERFHDACRDALGDSDWFRDFGRRYLDVSRLPNST